jgi:ISXO2-like transposase domain
MSERRVWKCRPCKKQFSVLTGTIMHATKIPVRTWVLVLFDMCTAKNGISAREIERRYGVCARTAWHMLHRIRQAMAGGDRLVDTMRGTVIADETWIGGEPRWRHHSRHPHSMRGLTEKTPVLSLLDIPSGQVRSRVMPRVTAQSLRKVIAEQVDMAGSQLFTDSARYYGPIGREFSAHQAVDHHAGEYVRGAVTTNHLEGFFAQLKRSLDGTHHHVSEEHLHRYVGEFDFRYSTCKMSDYGRMRTLARQMEGRLSYKRVTA